MENLDNYEKEFEFDLKRHPNSLQEVISYLHQSES